MQKNNYINQLKNLICYYNGKYIPHTEAKISVYDSSLMFGDMLFEMTRSFNHITFKLGEHLDRLYDGLKYFQIDVDFTRDDIKKIMEELIKRNSQSIFKDDEYRFMINVSRGPLSIYHSLFDKIEPTLIITLFPLSLTVGSQAHVIDGVNIVIPEQRVVTNHLIDPRVKSRSRVQYMMANLQISSYGNKTWALMLDDENNIAEGTGSNFFIVKDKTIITPPAKNILNGITRQYIFDLANYAMQNNGTNEYIEKELTKFDVATADEAFFTCTPFCITPATSFFGRPIGDGKVGVITKCLEEKWNYKIYKNTKEHWEGIWNQIKRFGKNCKQSETNYLSPR